MSSRLDRLFLLLETGSTPLTRKAAALQLGEVQKLHPHELNNLLVKVRQYLHSNSWETRIAASQAVEAIVTNVALWFPRGVPNQDDKHDSNVLGRMAFDKYDVNVVIRCGHNLMASEGKEYEHVDDFSASSNSTDDRDKIAHQRQLLNKKLGLDFAEKLGMQIDFISNTDLVVDQQDNNKPSIANQTKLNEIITQASGRSLKRKASSNHLLKKFKSETDCDLMSKKIKPEPIDGDGLSISNGNGDNLEGGDLFAGNEWPLAWFGDELMGDLFNAQWEIRHGAATGLREIVKLQGRCGGRLRNAPSHQMDSLNQQWLEDLSLRLLSVLALDRFGDFLTDQVVAPVRETCAQVLGLVIKLLTSQGVSQVVFILLQLLQCQEWEARHGGMLGLKYLLAIRQDMIDTLLPTVFDPIFKGLKDSADDVSAVAAAALVPVKDALMNLMPHKVPLVIRFLWEALLELDDLSSSTGDLLMLLSSLLTFKGLESNDNHHLDYDDQQLVLLIPRLWPFLFHSLSSVRKSVLDSLVILCEKSCNSWITSSLLSDAMRLIYQRSLIESVNSILDLLLRVWHCLVAKAKYDTLIEATCNYLSGWIILMIQPHKLAIDTAFNSVWLDIDQVTKHRNNRSTDDDTHTISDQYFIGGAEAFGETTEEREKCVVRARYQCAKLLGTLTFYLVEPKSSQTCQLAVPGAIQATPETTLESLSTLLLFYLNSKSAVQRMCISWIIKEWAVTKTIIHGETSPLWLRVNNQPEEETKFALHKPLADRGLEALSEPIYYEELSSLFGRVLLHARDFVNYLRTNKVPFNETAFADTTVYTLVQINQLVEEISSHSLPTLQRQAEKAKQITKKMKTLIETLEEKVVFMKKSLSDLSNQTNTLSIGVNSSIASALVAWQYLPEKLNPVVRPIMDSIKCEPNEQLHKSSATSLVQLLRLCCERIMVQPNPNSPVPKIIKNLVVFLCSDRNFTPEVVLPNDPGDSMQLGIITLVNMQKISEKVLSLRRCNSTNVAKNRSLDGEAGKSDSANHNGATSSNGINSNASNAQLDQASEKRFEIQRRGATLALCEACRYFGPHLPECLPTLWAYMAELASRAELPSLDPAGLEEAKILVQHLQVLEIVGPSLSAQLHSTLTSLFDYLCNCLESSYCSIRHMSARSYGMLATILPNETMNVVLCRIIDQLESPDAIAKRQGAVEAISCVIDRLQLNIVPYIVFLIVPMLGRMSDQNDSVRMLATQCFAQLVQLMPLDIDHHGRKEKDVKTEEQTDTQIKTQPTSSNKICSLNKCSTTSIKEMLSSSKINFSPELLKRKESERHFLEQLVDISKLDNYKLPIPVKAELRTYQQDGLNWLAFLKKYKLHGIIADEMGLGKTLQAICILASDHHHMLAQYERGESNNPPLPSIVICPPTLTGHWLYEVSKFVDYKHLLPILYSGPPFERTKLRTRIQRSFDWKKDNDGKRKPRRLNLVIVSYDLVRNDIDFFSSVRWNYCILDEGHVIKNGKTKLAKAIKTLPANHRLILTGTPIQNNVLELWSLFDFLMPGFLGTERQFMARYSKPILASRDAKSSSREQEAGVLAMEGLHRQVLPFILRRMKEDVLKDLPPKIIQDYYCELSSLQVRLYEDFSKSRARASLEEAISHEVEEIAHEDGNAQAMAKRSTARQGNPNTSHIFQSLQYLRKVCNHPKLVLTPSHPQYEMITQKLKEENTTLSDINHAAKLCALKQLLLDCGIGTQTATGTTEPVVNQHRALVFCQLKSMLDIVEKDLLKAHMPSVTYLRLDGNVPPNDRHGVVHNFNNDPSIDILLLTTQVGGLGLNLTGADTVIFVEHDWNPMKDLQAMDRAHRIGQKKVVNVYRLITTGTLEEKIMGLQKFKLTVANTVISSENASLDSMGTDQLLDLFELSSARQDKDKDGNPAAGCGGRQLNNSVSMKAMLENLPELWDVKQYESEYDLSNFLSSLSNPN